MRPILFLLLLAATSLGYMPPNWDPMEIARSFQKELDSAIIAHDRKSVLFLLSSSFTYQDCAGKISKRNEFAELMASSKTAAGVVTEARADKKNVIYIVQYGSKKNQFMLVEKFDGYQWYFKMNKGQQWLC